MDNDNNNQIHLNRSLGLFSALSLVIGTVIGSGIFFKQSSVLDYSNSTSVALLAWFVGGVITLTAGLTIAEIGALMPHTGGLYVYMEKIYGRLWGFLSGWMQIIVYGPAMIASLAAYLAILLVNFFGIPKTYELPIGIVAILLVMLFNLMSNKYGAAFQIITTVAKLMPIFAIIVFGLLYGKHNALNQVATSNGHFSLGNFGMAILATLFAYDGWILVANMGGEIKNPKKMLPLSITLGIGLVLIVYMLATLGIFRVMPASTIHALGENATPHFAILAFGELGGKLLNIGIIISIIGCMNGKIMTFPRIMYAMAKNEDLLFSKQLSYLDKKMHSPIFSILAVCFISIAMVILTDADRLSEICIFTVYVFYVMAFFGIFKLRKQHSTRPFSVPLYPLTPLIAILGALFVIVSELTSDFLGVLISFIFVALGVPIYYYRQNKKQKE